MYHINSNGMVNCPVCKKPMPFVRFPTSLKQAAWGGATCGYCGSEIDRKGNLIKKNKKKLKEYEDRLFREELIKEKARLQARKEFNKK